MEKGSRKTTTVVHASNGWIAVGGDLNIVGDVVLAGRGDTAVFVVDERPGIVKVPKISEKEQRVITRYLLDWLYQLGRHSHLAPVPLEPQDPSKRILPRNGGE